SPQHSHTQKVFLAALAPLRETPTSRRIAATARALSTPILKKFSWRPWRLCERPQPAGESPQQQEPSALPYSKSFLGGPGAFARDPNQPANRRNNKSPQHSHTQKVFLAALAPLRETPTSRRIAATTRALSTPILKK